MSKSDEIPVELHNLFESATNEMKKATKLPNSTLLKLYGLYKVATEGEYKAEKDKEIGLFDYTKKYKYDAWKQCSTLNKYEAMIEYIGIYADTFKINLPELDNIRIAKLENFTTEAEGLDFDNLDPVSFSCPAKSEQEEIRKFLETASNIECVFYEIKKAFENHKRKIDLEFFDTYKHIDCKLLNLTAL